jgi:flagellar motility protein MotE (MotC chaperone)
MSIELDKKKEIQNKKEGKVKNTTKNIKEITDKIISKSKLHQFLTEKELKASDKQRIDTIKKRVEKSGKKWKEFEEDIKELHKLFEDNRVVDNNI